jgi:phosphatidylserine decarboxylase
MRYLAFLLLPQRLLSRLTGRLVDIQWSPVAGLLKAVFLRLYALDLTEAEHPVAHYRSLQQLFGRRLRAGVRPISAVPVVSPVDGTFLRWGDIDEQGQVLVQAKGIDYPLAGLLTDADLARKFAGGRYAVVYLAPYNYHRIHSPVAGRVTETLHIPGSLWPVNAWSVGRVPALYCVNERTATVLACPLPGPASAQAAVPLVASADPTVLCAVVAVGAMNVGRIRLAYEPEFQANRCCSSAVSRWVPPTATSLQKGGELGAFELGSTVVLLFAREWVQAMPQLGCLCEGQTLKVGEPFGPVA